MAKRETYVSYVVEPRGEWFVVVGIVEGGASRLLGAYPDRGSAQAAVKQAG